MRKKTLLPAAALVVGLAAAPAVLFTTQPAAAQAAKKPDAKTRDQARTEYTAGEAAFKNGDFAAATVHFRKANELIPSVFAGFWLAQSLDKDGKGEEAASLYEKIAADEGFAKLGDEKTQLVKDRLAALKPALGKLAIESDPAGATVMVDGAPQMGETPLTLDLAPGKHSIRVQAPGTVAQEFDVEIKAGASEQKSLTLEAAEVEEPAPAPAVAAEEPAPAAPAKKAKSKVPAYVTLGIAGVAAGVGTFFGVQAMGKKGDYDDKPTSKTADDVERNALIADMAFGVALTLGVTGIVLLTTGGGDDGAEKAARYEKLPKRAKLVLAPYASPDGAGAAAQLAF